MIELLPNHSTSNTHPDDDAEYIFGVMAVTVNSLSQDNWDLLLDSGCHTHDTTLDDDRGKEVPGEPPPLRVATGTPLEKNGYIQVDLTVDGVDAAGQKMKLKMIKCTVTRALVSVGQYARKDIQSR